MDIIIVLDAGHGGKDRWNIGPTGYVEADGALDITLKTGKILNAYPQIKVLYTRTTDTNLYWENSQRRDLYSRAKFANDNKADYFVSIHSNAAQSVSAHGTETLCLAKGGQAEKLAKSIQTEAIKKLGLTDRGVKEKSIAVLRTTNMPAALIEVAFHSNPKEEVLLKQESFRQEAAEAIASGILKFLNIEEIPIDKNTVRIQLKNGTIINGILKDEVSYAPVREVAEGLGYKVGWIDEKKLVTIN